MLLELSEIRREYPEFALEAAFAVAEGEFFAILGPSGSGKTTLLRLVAGFDRPDRGRILLAGEDVTDLPPHRRRIGMIFQDYALFPHLSVGDNVGYGLKVQGVPPAERRRKVEALLGLTGLEGFYHRDPSSLSGGEKQRVAVARALAPEPLVLLLDEPFSALDQALRKRLRREIKDLQRRAGFTALFVTHSQEEALTLSDRMLVLSTGRMEQIGTPEEIYHRPGSEYVARFLGEMNRVPVMLAEGGWSFLLDGLSYPAPPGRRVTAGEGWLCFRPEQAELSETPREGPWLPVTIIERAFNGPTTMITVEGRGWTAGVLMFTAAAAALAAGRAAWLRVPVEEACLFG